MTPRDAREVGQAAKNVAGRRPRGDLVLGGDGFGVPQRPEHLRRRRTARPADAADLREVEVQPAAECLEQRPELRLGRGEAPEGDALGRVQQLFEIGQHLG